MKNRMYRVYKHCKGFLSRSLVMNIHTRTQGGLCQPAGYKVAARVINITSHVSPNSQPESM